MVDYKESFRVYRNWVCDPDCHGEMCNWYQDVARYHDEDQMEELTKISDIVKVMLFYIIAAPILALAWIAVVVTMTMYNLIWGNK